MTYRLSVPVLAAALALSVSCDGGSDPEVDSGPGTPDAGDEDRDSGPPPEVCQADPGPGPEPPDPGDAAPPPELDCGTPEFPDGTPLWRYPYLQSVTRTSARIAWTSTAGGEGVLRWAPGPDGPWTEVSATAESFPTSRTGQAEDYVAFDATVEGLEANSAYCYEIVEDGTVLARNLRFDTAWEGTDRPVRILALGDSGDSSDAQFAVRDAFMEQDYDVFLHLGDMAYNDGRFDEFEPHFFGAYRDTLHRIPVFPTMGNHEFITNSGQPYLDVYYLFEQAWQERDQERYYSFDYGNIHFTSLDSNEGTLIPIYLDTNGRNDNDMFDWLIDDIGGSDADWKIVFMHHPFYSSSERGVRWSNVDRFRSLLEEAGVDLILVGHDHHYERTVPLRGRCTSPEPDGITEIIAGGGGRSLRTIEDTTRWYSATSFNTDYSFLRLDVHGCRLHGQAFDTASNVVDDFVLNGCD
ncbi:MAG TPA: metallophosphoesterase family protein [Sandaracinaceae bacterium LLY-WYZ-13_1]|nr:metallophosphoesterase family protein [Sandaracinaceae bacterium LLY-WYZ-13_1]